MAAPNEIIELIERFSRNVEDYKSADYKEARLRKEFLDPFFGALGWDMDNKAGHAEAYKDVIHEDSIKFGNNPEAPDYCFRIGGTRKFFVEAKKPSVNIKTDIHPAYQLRRYAWSSKLPLSILTDFEEFSWFDCRVKPVKTDEAHTARLKYLTYRQYPDAWDEIAGIFSKDAVLKGSFDRYAVTTKGKKGTSEVDDAFLAEIESWRDDLAHNIALRNPALTRRQLNFAVQRTIDRIIFLRICEDRSIEEYQTLMALQNGANVYKRLCEYFYKADQRYNSGLFHFTHEKGEAEPPDDLSPSLVIDDKPLKTIIKRLYYPDSPYEFSVLPADILGQVYEQFLGKVIRLTDGHRAVVEEKPEVKKAGGVFYTPTYIVDYIVANTVGALLEGKTPDAVSTLRILDPACGSGSFLIGAYQCLLDWHLDWYLGHKLEKWSSGRNPRIVMNEQRVWKLSTEERKRILLNNIYGVDIDTQAVEVTKLSLLLKVLEGETKKDVDNRLKLFHDRALPDLAANIKCGNSLIGSDFYEGAQLSLSFMDEEERLRINVFDWEKEFSDIFRTGGFDVVIGNPPYVRSQLIEVYSKKYFFIKYETSEYQPDTFSFFIEKGIKLLTVSGYLGFIIPNGILTNTYYSPLRKFIINKTEIGIIVDLKSGVFCNASVDTSIFILKRTQSPNKNHEVRIGEYVAKINNRVETPSNKLSQETFSFLPEYSFNTSISNTKLVIINKINSVSSALEKYFNVYAGMKVRKDFISNIKMTPLFKPFLIGKNIKPYLINWNSMWVCYDKQNEGKFTNQAYRDESIFTNPNKLLVRQIMGKNKIFSTIDSDVYYCDQSIYILIPKGESIEIKFVLGMISSKLISFYFKNTNFDRKKTFPKIKGIQIKQLPIRAIDFTSPADVARHDRMVSLATAMLELHKQCADAKTADEKMAIKRIIDSTDAEIDRLVYELYDLTEEEIRIVEAP